MRHWVLGQDPNNFLTFSSYNGSEIELSTVRDELFTPPFLAESSVWSWSRVGTFYHRTPFSSGSVRVEALTLRRITPP